MGDRAEIRASALYEQILRQRSARLAEDHIDLAAVVSTQAVKSSMGDIGKPLAIAPRLSKTRRQRAHLYYRRENGVCRAIADWKHQGSLANPLNK
jgi:hypothetical protein